MAASLVFGKYEIIRRLAVGGMGEIFLARQSGVEGFERLVILKTLLPDLAKDVQFVEMFLDEARVAATLNHPQIVAIYEVGAWQGSYVIAMEYIHGDSLAGLQAFAASIGERFPYNVVAKIGYDAAVALHHAHTAAGLDGRPLGIVHRDISPQNIMVRQDGVTKVVDFGIARAANRATRTATGTVKGKLAYMAPEQLRSERLDGRTDECALGVVLWELCTGERLLESDDVLRIAEGAMQPLPKPSSRVVDVPAELERIVLRMTERDPAARYPTCADVAQALKTFLLGYSRETSEGDVAQFVARVVGDELDARTRDLTPDAGAFPSGLAPTAPLGIRPAPPVRSHRGRAPAVAIILLCAGIGLGTAWWLGLGDERGQSRAPAPPVSSPPAPEQRPLPVAPARAPEATRPSPAKRAKAGHHRPVAAPAPAASPGYLSIATDPFTTVIIAGESRGVTPLFKLSLAAGKHVIRLVNETAGIDTTREVAIQAGQTTKLNLRLTP